MTKWNILSAWSGAFIPVFMSPIWMSGNILWQFEQIQRLWRKVLVLCGPLSSLWSVLVPFSSLFGLKGSPLGAVFQPQHASSLIPKALKTWVKTVLSQQQIMEKVINSWSVWWNITQKLKSQLFPLRSWWKPNAGCVYSSGQRSDWLICVVSAAWTWPDSKLLQV